MNAENESEIKRYLDIKIVNGQSPQTIVNYKRLLGQLGNHLKEKSFRDANEQNIIEFLAYKKKIVNDVTMQSFKIAIKAFYRFLYSLKRGEYPQQVLNIDNGNHFKHKSPIRPEDIITKDDIALLVKHCKNYRDEAIVVALYESGCRISEFVNLNIGYLLFDEKGLVMLVEGKTGERRIRLIESVPYIQKWLENHPLKHDRNAPLWVTFRESYLNQGEKHARLSTNSIRAILDLAKRDSKLNKPTNPHAFRHSRLTELAKFLSDGKLKVFAGWTGASSMAGVYVHLSGEDLDKDLLQIAGVEIKEEKKDSPLKVKECSRCHCMNPGTADFCMLCGRPFDKESLVEQELETQLLKEKYEVAVEGIEGMMDEIERLGKEIQELKKR